MRRIRLTVAYDGTDYCGWQIQPNGITIEEVLNKALFRLTGEPVKVVGASRTDAGVHALGNTAVFDTDTTIPPERIAYALNRELPADVVAVRSEEVPLGWHPRRLLCGGLHGMCHIRWMWNVCGRRHSISRESMISGVFAVSIQK